MSAQITLNLNSSEEFAKLLELLQTAGLDGKVTINTNFATEPSEPRSEGWGKGLFSNISDDFDETPSGFEGYMLPAQN